VVARRATYQFTVVPSALIKVGLGSSGAAAVLFAAALALLDGSSPSPLELIVAAHRFETDISGRECGPQDHAASVYGGLNLIEYPSLFSNRIPTARIWPALTFWTADERRDAPEIIKEIAAAHTDAIWERKAELTRRIAAACVNGDPGALVEAMWAEARIQAELGMLTQRQRETIAVVQSVGGAAKVTGAGGGGVLVALATGAARERVVEALTRRGLKRLTLAPGENGLALGSGSETR
jgi:mevalonate kinase